MNAMEDASHKYYYQFLSGLYFFLKRDYESFLYEGPDWEDFAFFNGATCEFIGESKKIEKEKEKWTWTLNRLFTEKKNAPVIQLLQRRQNQEKLVFFSNQPLSKQISSHTQLDWTKISENEKKEILNFFGKLRAPNKKLTETDLKYLENNFHFELLKSDLETLIIEHLKGTDCETEGRLIANFWRYMCSGHFKYERIFREEVRKWLSKENYNKIGKLNEHYLNPLIISNKENNLNNFIDFDRTFLTVNKNFNNSLNQENNTKSEQRVDFNEAILKSESLNELFLKKSFFLIGDPGTGKSYLIKHKVSDWINNLSKIDILNKFYEDEFIIPFFIEPQDLDFEIQHYKDSFDLSYEKLLHKIITNTIVEIDIDLISLEFELFTFLFDQKKILIIFDGLNEINFDKHQRTFFEKFLKYIDKLGNKVILISTQEPSFNLSFDAFQIQNLSNNEPMKLLSKILKCSEEIANDYLKRIQFFDTLSNIPFWIFEYSKIIQQKYLENNTVNEISLFKNIIDNQINLVIKNSKIEKNTENFNKILKSISSIAFKMFKLKQSFISLKNENLSNFEINIINFRSDLNKYNNPDTFAFKHSIFFELFLSYYLIKFTEEIEDFPDVFLEYLNNENWVERTKISSALSFAYKINLSSIIENLSRKDLFACSFLCRYTYIKDETKIVLLNKLNNLNEKVFFGNLKIVWESIGCINITLLLEEIKSERYSDKKPIIRTAMSEFENKQVLDFFIENFKSNIYEMGPILKKLDPMGFSSFIKEKLKEEAYKNDKLELLTYLVKNEKDFVLEELKKLNFNNFNDTYYSLIKIVTQMRDDVPNWLIQKILNETNYISKDLAYYLLLKKDLNNFILIINSLMETDSFSYFLTDLEMEFKIDYISNRRKFFDYAIRKDPFFFDLYKTQLKDLQEFSVNQNDDKLADGLKSNFWIIQFLWIRELRNYGSRYLGYLKYIVDKNYNSMKLIAISSIVNSKSELNLSIIKDLITDDDIEISEFTMNQINKDQLLDLFPFIFSTKKNNRVQEIYLKKLLNDNFKVEDLKDIIAYFRKKITKCKLNSRYYGINRLIMQFLIKNKDQLTIKLFIKDFDKKINTRRHNVKVYQFNHELNYTILQNNDFNLKKIFNVIIKDITDPYRFNDEIYDTLNKKSHIKWWSDLNKIILRRKLKSYGLIVFFLFLLIALIFLFIQFLSLAS